MVTTTTTSTSNSSTRSITLTRIRTRTTTVTTTGTVIATAEALAWGIQAVCLVASGLQQRLRRLPLASHTRSTSPSLRPCLLPLLPSPPPPLQQQQARAQTPSLGFKFRADPFFGL